MIFRMVNIRNPGTFISFHNTYLLMILKKSLISDYKTCQPNK